MRSASVFSSYNNDDDYYQGEENNYAHAYDDVEGDDDNFVENYMV